MMRYILLLAFLLLLPQKAQALCVGLGVALKNMPATITYAGTGGGYAVYAASDVMQTVNFQVEVLVAALGCNYYIVMSPGSSNNVNQRQMPRSAGGGTLDYNAYTTVGKAAILKDNGAGAGERINGSFGVVAVGATNNHSFYWAISPLQVVAAGAGYFQDSVTVSLYQEKIFTNNYVLADSKTVTFRAVADSSIDLSLVDSGGSFSASDTTQTVDFDTLTSGETLAYDTLVRSNDGYSITMQSANGQVMKHESAPSVSSTVPYTLTLGGVGANLSSGSAVTVKTHTGTTPAAGDRLGTSFSVGTLNGAEAPGNYSDVITVTVSAH